ncbi:MAG: sigma 54-interacting transcriptional regulator [Deltaproteobacteria bacterium]|nr:sigma 54-interacting transcriptional regulator [Deltaproteobacteria bacterium]
MKKMEKTTNLAYNDIMAVAALFEGAFSIDWIIELTELSASKILSAFEDAIEKKILLRKDAGEFSFKNKRQQKKFLDALDSKEKAIFHQKIAAILLRNPIDNDEKIHSIAKHLLHLDYDFTHCQLLMKSGDMYRYTHQFKDADRCYSKILIDLKDKKEDEEIYLYINAAINASKIVDTTVRSKELIPILKNAIVKAEANGMKRQIVLLELHLAKNEWYLSNYSKALKTFERGFSMSSEIDDDGLRRSSAAFNTFFLYFQGRFKEVVQCYEGIMEDVEKYPLGQFSAMATVMIGVSYVFTGQVTQGFGLLDSIHNYCKIKKYDPVLCQTNLAFGALLLGLGRIDDALRYLKTALEKATMVTNHRVELSIFTHMALLHQKKGHPKKSLSYLKKYTDRIRKEDMFIVPYSSLLELCWVLEQDGLPKVGNVSLKREIDRSVRSKNYFDKGLGYYYRGLLLRRQGHPRDSVIQAFENSLKWLNKSGSKAEIAQTLYELSKEYIAKDAGSKAQKVKQRIQKIIHFIGVEFVPNDLKLLLKDLLTDQDLYKVIILLNQKLTKLRDNKELVHQIISTANHITGSERGAIFLIDKDSPSTKLKLRAARNLTSEDVTHPSFKLSMETIKKAVSTGECQVMEIRQNQNDIAHQAGAITSCICVPMNYKDEVVGVLYHDNRLFSNKHNKGELEVLQYFATQASIAMDNVNAYEEIKNLARKLKEEKQQFEEQDFNSIHFDEIVGKNPSFMDVLKDVDRVAGTDATVLIQGETGVGKELIARATHRSSPRKDGPFIRVNCSAFPDTLIASELFGHEKGAFTGATEKRLGRFELAHNGTLFLDEIGDISIDVQIRLLRVLQSKEFERVGGEKTLYSDFRLVVATNRDLKQLITEGKFREDLFFRLNVFPIHVPPIRERKEDIPLLAQHFLKIYAGKLGKSIERISKADMKKLIAYDWPGNVRELENVIERGVILSFGSGFQLPDLKAEELAYASEVPLTTLAEMERLLIVRAIKAARGKIFGPGGAAELLDIHSKTLYSRMKKHGIDKKNVVG